MYIVHVQKLNNDMVVMMIMMTTLLSANNDDYVDDVPAHVGLARILYWTVHIFPPQ